MTIAFAPEKSQSPLDYGSHVPQAGRTAVDGAGYEAQARTLSPCPEGEQYAAQSRALAPKPTKGKVIGSGPRVTVYKTGSTAEPEKMGTVKTGARVRIHKVHASGWVTIKAKVALSGGGTLTQYCNIPKSSLDMRTTWKALPGSSKATEPTLANTGDAADPTKTDRATTFAAPPVNAELAVRGKGDRHKMAANDVRQGALGDCTFLAVVRALVRADPGLIRRIIRKVGSDRYAVTFRRGGKKSVVTVTHNMPSNAAGGITYAQYDQNEPELWVMVLEKAYAEFKGGYHRIGGSNQDAIEAITGKGAQYNAGYIYCDKTSEDDILKYIDAALPKQPVFTSTKFGLVRPPHGIPSSTRATHAYSIEKVDMKARKLDVMNPWGSSHLIGLPIAEYKKYFLGCGTIKTR